MDTFNLTHNIITMKTTETEPILKFNPIKSNEKKEKKQKNKKQKNRCSFEGCNKKLGITSFPCKCNHSYCANHLMPELHACTFDYIKQGQEQIRKKNPVVIGSKVTQI